MDLSEAIKEAYSYADAAITLFDTFEISHSSWMTVNYIRLVDSDLMLLTPQGSFDPIEMNVSLPETEAAVRGQLKITLKCLPKLYRDALYSVVLEADPLYLRYRQYTGSNVQPDMELPVPLSVSSVEFKGDLDTQITCLYPDLVNIPFCRRIMTTTALPGGKT